VEARSGGEGAVGSRTLGEILVADERLLEAARPAARAEVVARRSVSFGVGAPPTPGLLGRANLLGFDVERRTTGGSGLVHLPGDLTWSVVLPRSDPRVGRGFVRAYGRLGAGAVRFLAGLGLDGHWVDAPGVVPQYCTLSGRGQVLAVGGRIVGGAAQHATRAGVLHQGVLSFTIDRPAIARVFDLADPLPLDRLCGLVELGAAAPPSTLAGELRRSIEGTLVESPDGG
jgi:lipoate-protein ligase A